MTNEESKFVGLCGPPSENWNENLSFAELLMSKLKNANPNAVAQVEYNTGRELTYGRLIRDSLSAAQGLKSRGIDENGVVVIVAFQSHECTIVMLASLFLGASVAVLNPSLTPEEMTAQCVNLPRVDVFFTEYGALNAVKQTLSTLERDSIIVISEGCAHDCIPFQDLTQHSELEFKATVRNPKEHVSLIICSSGTSAVPKGIAIPDLYLARINGSHHRPNSVGQTILLGNPVFWISGTCTLLRSLLGETRLVFFREPAKDEDLLRAIHIYRPTMFFTATSSLNKILASSRTKDFDLTSLRLVLAGGTVMRADTVLRLQKEVFQNRIPVLQLYGMTEVGFVSRGEPHANKPGSCGKVLSGVKVKIVDLNTGESLGVGEPGEICVKTPYPMTGYLGNVASPFDKDGWYHSGDLGYYDEDGFIFVVDRINELINYKSFRIPPSDIESVLMQHEAVTNAAVVGIPHSTDGERATAFVVTRKAISDEDLLHFVAEQLPEHKHLRGGLRFVEAIPMTSTGKLNKRILRAQQTAES